MKKYFFIFLINLSFFLYAQETHNNTLDWDINSIFDNEDTELEEIIDEHETPPVLSQIRRRGFYFSTNYEFNLGIAPGWHYYPWTDTEDNPLFLDRGIKLISSFTFDAQISDVFRVVTTLGFDIPPFFYLYLTSFYFDYNFYDKLFVRAGRYDMAWGISPNFGFTNLLARVPAESYIGESYIFKVDYPIGKGGLQLLTLTRGDVTLLKKEDFGFGAKYNIALQSVDLDFGLYYLEAMPFRSFLSLKKTLWNTEIYTEGLLAVDINDNYDISGAVNLGFARSFFDDRFSLNGEFFFNAEKDAYSYHSKEGFKEEGTTPLIEQFTMALNLSYKIIEKINLRFFTNLLYAPSQNSAHVTPGFISNPWQHFEFVLAVPTAVGSEDGYYRNNTPRWAPGDIPLPFAIVFLIRISGGV